jgi:hypothetical protein
MIWKLLLVPEKSWRALNAPRLMRDVYDGKRFKDGIAVCTRDMLCTRNLEQSPRK